MSPSDIIQASVVDRSNLVLASWVFAFASSHIGMSAVRTPIISSLGGIANRLDLVGNDDWTLPAWWPGDSSAGGNRIFATELTAGRQVYRALYTAVSFITLGSALGAYLHCSSIAEGVQPVLSIEQMSSTFTHDACLAAAALSFGAAIASLFNASPLGLMPSFEASPEEDDGKGALSGNTIAGLRRDDTLKFTTRGLTRITRHPLILPVAPWGFATAYLAGNRPCDYILFGGLSVYAIAGCLAQDMRVIREEGSVGTVFQTERQQGRSEANAEGERMRLRLFFEETSFVPFNAVLDGRQRLDDILREGPWLQFVIGTILGVYIEREILFLVREWST